MKPQANLQPDTLLENRYMILSVIGVGGMGAVYKARDMHFPNAMKLVAVKEMVNQERDILARQTIIEHFEREANILVTLSHPSIPKIYDYFTYDNCSYLVLEFIQGNNLEQLIAKSQEFFPEVMVVTWAIELCDVLHFLHSHTPQPIVFRDMKPSNVMINQYNRVVLIDFGIAKIFQTGSKGTMVGTEGYASPEQYRGDDSPLVDIYALGATLHHLLTKRDPRLEAPFTFHERKIRDVNPAISEPLVKIIEKALNYDPSARYQNALEMKEALIEVSHNLLYASGQPSTFSSTPLASASPFSSDNNRIAWKHPARDEIRGSATCYDGVVYFGSYDKDLVACDADTGESLWEYECDGGIISKPVNYQNLVIFGSEDKCVYALSTYDGKMLWKFLTRGPVRSSPTLTGSTVFIGSDDGFVYALDATEGYPIWKFDGTSAVRSKPCYIDDHIYFGTEAGDVVCAGLQESVIWRFRSKRGILSSPAVIDKNLLGISSLDSHIYALDIKTGTIKWKFKMGKGSVSTPYISEGMLIVGSADNMIYCVQASTGQEIWKYRTENQVSGSPVAYKGKVYCGSADGKLYCLSQNKGEYLWSVETGGPITGIPCILNNRLFIGSMDHNLYAIDI